MLQHFRCQIIGSSAIGVASATAARIFRMLDWNDYLRIFTGLFAIVAQVSTVSMFLNFTENVKTQRKRIARASGWSLRQSEAKGLSATPLRK